MQKKHVLVNDGESAVGLNSPSAQIALRPPWRHIFSIAISGDAVKQK